MKSKISIVLGFILLLSFFPSSALAQESAYKQQVISISTGSKTVTYVIVDLNHPGIQVHAAVANGQLGTTASLKDIAGQMDTESHSVVAAINGTFFSAYDGIPIPWGDIVQAGEFVHFGNIGSTIGFTAANEAVIQSLSSSIQGYINGKNAWYAWNINHIYNTPESVVIYTPLFGSSTPKHNLTSIVIDKGRVRAILQGTTSIPAGGYVIVTGMEGIVRAFSVGDQVEYAVHTQKRSTTSTGVLEVDWNEKIVSAIGAGPTLLRDGVIIADGTAEGFTESKINETRAQRSFIGVTTGNQLIMGTVPSVNLKELAEICKKLGLVQAMNLDGGASSGLLYKGQMKTSPGRLLSNALVVTLPNPNYQPPIQILVDGKKLSTQVQPAVINERTLLPLRSVFEALGAQVTWDPSTQTATGTKGNLTLQITEGESYALINEKKLLLDTPCQKINNALFVPVRVVAEGLGASVKWDAVERIVYLFTH